VTASRSSHSARLLAVSALFAGLAALSACSVGQLTQTSNQVPPITGVNATSEDGSIALRNVQVAYSGLRGYARGASAPLVVRIFNDGQGPVKLVRVTAEGAQRVVLSGGAAATPSPEPAASPTSGPSASPAASGSPPAPSRTPAPSPTQPAGQSTFLAIEIAPSSFVALVPGQGQYLQLVGLTAPLTPGQSVPMTFGFDNNIEINLTVPFGMPTAPGPREAPVEPAE